MKISTITAPHHHWGGDCDRWGFVDRQDLAVIYERMPPDRCEVRHKHIHAAQLFFVLTGQLTIEVEGTEYQISSNEALEVTPTQRHQVFNKADEAAEFLVISQPSTFEDRVHD